MASSVFSAENQRCVAAHIATPITTKCIRIYPIAHAQQLVTERSPMNQSFTARGDIETLLILCDVDQFLPIADLADIGDHLDERPARICD
ncbi:MAG: hypothetical protein AB199_00575 [Parcubacteria bacterium C7867-004]|nr:MAG: hypothetical protein AB199_00575 [Parcubacteria bacterium C7867-004]